MPHIVFAVYSTHTHTHTYIYAQMRVRFASVFRLANDTHTQAIKFASLQAQRDKQRMKQDRKQMWENEWNGQMQQARFWKRTMQSDFNVIHIRAFRAHVCIHSHTHTLKHRFILEDKSAAWHFITNTLFSSESNQYFYWIFVASLYTHRTPTSKMFVKCMGRPQDDMNSEHTHAHI